MRISGWTDVCSSDLTTRRVREWRSNRCSLPDSSLDRDGQGHGRRHGRSGHIARRRSGRAAQSTCDRIDRKGSCGPSSPHPARKRVDDERSTPRRSVGASAQSRRSEEHTSELQSLMRISYAVFCLKKKKTTKINEVNNIPYTYKTREA